MLINTWHLQQCHSHQIKPTCSLHAVPCIMEHACVATGLHYSKLMTQATCQIQLDKKPAYTLCILAPWLLMLDAYVQISDPMCLQSNHCRHGSEPAILLPCTHLHFSPVSHPSPEISASEVQCKLFDSNVSQSEFIQISQSHVVLCQCTLYIWLCGGHFQQLHVLWKYLSSQMGGEVWMRL